MTHSKKLLLAIILPLLALVSPVAHAQTVTNLWTGTAFNGTDPYYGSSVHAYRTGTTAILIVSILNTFARYMNVTSVTFVPDWGTNSTATITTPIRINPGQLGTATVSIPVPATNIATNLVRHGYNVYVTYTTPPPGPPGIQTTNTGEAMDFVVYSIDQASAMSLMNQFGLPSTFGFSTSPCFSTFFKSSEATSLCLQASNQITQGSFLYATGNFTGAKNVLQNAVSLWNQAISTESSKGGSLQQAAIYGGYGSILLGVGALIGAGAAVIYALRRFGSSKVPATTSH
jgi:hypothetical protein